jgi:hypothetical protein
MVRCEEVIWGKVVGMRTKNVRLEPLDELFVDGYKMLTSNLWK